MPIFCLRLEPPPVHPPPWRPPSPVYSSLSDESRAPSPRCAPWPPLLVRLFLPRCAFESPPPLPLYQRHIRVLPQTLSIPLHFPLPFPLRQMHFQGLLHPRPKAPLPPPSHPLTHLFPVPLLLPLPLPFLLSDPSANPSHFRPQPPPPPPSPPQKAGISQAVFLTLVLSGDICPLMDCEAVDVQTLDWENVLRYRTPGPGFRTRGPGNGFRKCCLFSVFGGPKYSVNLYA